MDIMRRNATVRPVLGESPQGHVHLSSATLLSAYGTNGTLNATGLQQAFAAIIACQVKHAGGRHMQLAQIVVVVRCQGLRPEACRWGCDSRTEGVGSLRSCKAPRASWEAMARRTRPRAWSQSPLKRRPCSQQVPAPSGLMMCLDYVRHVKH